MARLRARISAIPRQERLALGIALALSLAIPLIFVYFQRHALLVGDEPEYDAEGRFFVNGMWWWSSIPFGIAHASALKTPIYPAWVGFWYSVFGSRPVAVEAVQAFLCPVTVLLTWVLTRRLFNSRAAMLAAFGVAVFPLVWEYSGLLYPEALAVPLTMLVLLVVLGRDPTPRRALGTGALIGVALLLRPNSFVLLAAAAAAWIVVAGWRRGLLLTAIASLMAIIVVSPWTIRNALTETVGVMPLSVQDGAIFGTFNPESASDPVHPYAWRPELAHPPPILAPGAKPVSDSQLRSQLVAFGTNYIDDHPDSLLKAFYWNGLVRTWDIQHPSYVLNEVRGEGGVRAVTGAGLGMYYLFLPLSIVGIWLARRRREIVLPVLALALATSIVFTVAAATRYRATLEPVIVMFAAVAITELAHRRNPVPDLESSV